MDANRRDTDAIRVLHVVPTYFPAVAFGGPIFSTRAICDGVSMHEEVTVEVLTTDAASGAKGDRLALAQNPSRFPAGYAVRYCKRLAGVSISIELLARLPGAILRSDVVHLTGPYNFPVIPTLLLSRIFRRPVVWSPRGGFQATEQWTGSPNRRIKIAFEKVCNLVRSSQTVLHVTAHEESKFSRRRLRGVNTALIPNSVIVPKALAERVWRPEGKLRIVFLSRVHQKKGLEELIEAMALLPDFTTLEIFGEGTEDYVASLQQRIARLGCHDRVWFRGHVDGDEKTQAFVGGDIFCLPTHSENFGIVIAEALAHGTPVVTTVNAPWQQIEAEGVGAWVEATPQALAEAILELSRNDLSEVGERGRNWMRRSFSQDAMARDFVELYRKMARR